MTCMLVRNKWRKYAIFTTDLKTYPDSWCNRMACRLWWWWRRWQREGMFGFAHLTIDRRDHTATLLNDGTVLITGGKTTTNVITTLDSAEIFDPAIGLFTPLASAMTSTRSGHTATLLNDGTVLIAGGITAASGILASAEIYDPATGLFTLAFPMNSARQFHAATRLNDGTVLISGGFGGAARLDSAEVFDPATGVFELLANPMTIERVNHTATLLDDGRVLITGNFVGNTVTSSAEVYDPNTEMFMSLVETMVSARINHTASLLNDGKVLIAGGWDETFQFSIALRSLIRPPTRSRLFWSVP